MSLIKQLLVLHRQRQGIKAIAVSLSMSRNTVKTYLFKLDKLHGDPVRDLSVEQILALEEPEIYHLFHPGNPSYKDDRYEHFNSYIGFKTMVHSSGESDRKGYMTYRHHQGLGSSLIECA